MKKVVLLKLLSFALVIVLLSVPVFARSRISFLDDVMGAMMEDDYWQGSTEVDLSDSWSSDLPIKFAGEILLKKVRNREIEIQIERQGTWELKSFVLPLNKNTESAIRDLRWGNPTTAKYFDEKIGKRLKVVFTINNTKTIPPVCTIKVTSY